MRHEEGHTPYTGSKIWGDISVVLLKIIHARRGGPATRLGDQKIRRARGAVKIAGAQPQLPRQIAPCIVVF